MKIVSWNVNGIRACIQKGFFDVLEEINPDLLFLQETKISLDQLTLDMLHPNGYHTVWHSAKKPGYSGVALLTKKKPVHVFEGFGISRYDDEGRVIGADFKDKVFLGVYFPNGQKNDERLQYKLDFYKDFFIFCEELKQQGKEVLVCGDFNTAHQEIDLARPKENEDQSGFLPVERAWMDKLFNTMGYVDTFRLHHQDPHQYSWWSFRTAARKRNIGWRIDYVIVTNNLAPLVKEAFILPEILGSDHCPVGIVLND